MSKWRLPEMVGKYKAHRERVIADSVWNELHENAYEIARLKRENAELRSNIKALVKRLRIEVEA